MKRPPPLSTLFPSTTLFRSTKDDREVDFVALRQALARNESWVGPLHDRIQPKARRKA